LREDKNYLLEQEFLMRSMWMGMICAVAIAIVAGVVMTGTGSTSAQEFSSSSTRL